MNTIEINMYLKDLTTTRNSEERNTSFLYNRTEWNDIIHLTTPLIIFKFQFFDLLIKC